MSYKNLKKKRAEFYSIVLKFKKNSSTQPPTASNVFKFLLTFFQALNRSKKPIQ
jgi:hypothetical protein